LAPLRAEAIPGTEIRGVGIPEAAVLIRAAAAAAAVLYRAVSLVPVVLMLVVATRTAA